MMRLATPLCPECGEPARGTVEHLSGVAEFDGDPSHGAVEYGGWTDVFWNEQHTAHQKDDAPAGPDNLPLVCCADGHTWPTAIDWESEAVATAGKTESP